MHADARGQGDPDLTIGEQIDAAHYAFRIATESALSHAIRAGELLLREKVLRRHGEWSVFLATLSFCEETARGYMRLAKAPPEKRERVAGLSLRRALAEIATPRGRPAARTADIIPLKRKKGAVDGQTVQQQTQKPAGTTTIPIADINVMPRGHWRDVPSMQPQILAQLLDAWDEASDETRLDFLTRKHDEVMMAVVIRSAKGGS